MTAAERAKKEGFKSLKELSESVNVSTQTLCNWFNKNNLVFEAVVVGSYKIKIKDR